MDGVSQGGDPRSPRIPDVDRLKSGTIPTLRAIFAGIGRIVLAAERPADQQTQHPSPAQAASRWRSLDLTGNVRLLSPEDLAGDFPDDAAGGEPAAAGPTPAEPTVPAEVSVAGAHSENGAPLLPMDGYDALSLASIRARLRMLDLTQVRVLASYERTHADRPEVLGMLERRIAKLEAGG
jgi:hypothetical protein